MIEENHKKTSVRLVAPGFEPGISLMGVSRVNTEPPRSVSANFIRVYSCNSAKNFSVLIAGRGR